MKADGVTKEYKNRETNKNTTGQRHDSIKTLSYREVINCLLTFNLRGLMMDLSPRTLVEGWSDQATRQSPFLIITQKENHSNR